MHKFIIYKSAFIFVSTPFFAVSAAMESSRYKMQFDSVNVGGVQSNASGLQLDDTVGENGSGRSQSESYNLGSGFRYLTQDSYIAIQSPVSVSMPSISGLLGGQSITSGTWRVTTDNAAGYSLSIRAGTSPALKSPLSSIADYAPAGAVPDYTFSISSSDSEFGFSPEGQDIVDRYRDNGSTCGNGVQDTADKCWDGFSTLNKTISQSSVSNQPSGTATTIKFQAAVGSSHIQESDNYTATVIVTAVAL